MHALHIQCRKMPHVIKVCNKKAHTKNFQRLEFHAAKEKGRRERRRGEKSKEKHTPQK